MSAMEIPENISYKELMNYIKNNKDRLNILQTLLFIDTWSKSLYRVAWETSPGSLYELRRELLYRMEKDLNLVPIPSQIMKYHESLEHKD